MKKIFIFTFAIFLAACGGKKQSAETSAEQQKPTMDAVAKPAEGAAKTETETNAENVDGVTSATAVANSISFNGTMVVPTQSHATVSVSMGGTVKSTSLLAGMHVSKGQTLATLENPEFIALQQTYLDSHAQTEFLEKEYKRQQTLAEQEAASQKKFQQSKADYLSMKSRKDAAAAQLSLLGVNAQNILTNGISPYIVVHAPISGYVTQMMMNPGKHIAAGEPMCEIMDKSHVLIKLAAYEKDLDSIHINQRLLFRVNGMGKTPFSAHIISIGQQVDDTNRSLEVFARVDESNPKFRQGMYITARIAATDEKKK